SCRGKPKGDAVDAEVAAAAPPAQKTGEDATAALDLIDDLGRCEVDHGGALIDLGSPAAHGITDSWTLAPDASLVESERDGETWVKVMSRSFSMRFMLDEPTAAFVSMRARGGLSRSVSIAIDGKPLDVLPLIRGQARVVS